MQFSTLRSIGLSINVGNFVIHFFYLQWIFHKVLCSHPPVESPFEFRNRLAILLSSVLHNSEFIFAMNIWNNFFVQTFFLRKLLFSMQFLKFCCHITLYRIVQLLQTFFGFTWTIIALRISGAWTRFTPKTIRR